MLDLDETLVHYEIKNGIFRVRPYAIDFLRDMSKYYELVIFTAGTKEYADWILDDVDSKRYISHRLYREFTVPKGFSHLKDLSKIGRDLNKTIIVDNIRDNFSAQPENGIAVKSWFCNPEDRVLKEMMPFLISIVKDGIQDVR